MDIFDWANDMLTQAGVTLKAAGIVIALIAFFGIIGWGGKVTLGRLVIGLFVAGGIIAVVAKPDLLETRLRNTFSATAPAPLVSSYGDLGAPVNAGVLGARTVSGGGPVQL